ncbi:conserved hypothetical protein [Candidatus Desulfarcum epimagneticum]|uniref:DUF4911 domain-containing protein n=1 Tax=uncultured Desulfobacteraceae bacterium TaxID=218296 RepID=A0A484HDS3_9BACT|nr:conserved hypothetical protein [uncultured Desulfobacteraceae bacterium]
MRTIQKHLRIKKKEIAFFKFILEAYDGMAGMTTIDSASGHVVLNIAPGREDDAHTFLREMRHDMEIEDRDGF